MRTMEMEFHIVIEPPSHPCSGTARYSEKFSAAKALPRKPESVMATWIVARKRAGCSVSLARRLARRFPVLARRSSRRSFIEITAISRHANTAFEAISATCSKISRKSELPIVSPGKPRRHGHPRRRPPWAPALACKRISTANY